MWLNYCFMVYVVNLSIIFFEYIYIYTKTSPSFEKKNKNVDTQNREQTESWCYCNSRACPQRGIINNKLYIKFIFVLWMGFKRINLLWNSWKVYYISINKKIIIWKSIFSLFFLNIYIISELISLSNLSFLLTFPPDVEDMLLFQRKNTIILLPVVP